MSSHCILKLLAVIGSSLHPIFHIPHLLLVFLQLLQAAFSLTLRVTLAPMGGGGGGYDSVCLSVMRGTYAHQSSHLNAFAPPLL